MCFTASHGCTASLCLIIFLIRALAWGLLSAKCNVFFFFLRQYSVIYAKAICPRTSVTESVGAALFYRENNVKSDKKDKEGRQ